MKKKINLKIFFLLSLLFFVGCGSTFKFISPIEPQDPNFIFGIVLTPDGDPAEGTKFTLLTGPQSLYYPEFPDDIFGKREKAKLTIYTVGKDGQFKIPKPKKHYLSIAFVHDSGCAEFSYKNKPWTYIINLKKWGSLKGKLSVNSKPVLGEELTLDSYGVIGRIKTQTDRNGNFEFKYVPPKPAMIYITHRLVSHLVNMPHPRYIDVKAGKCTEIDMNARGATLKGTVRMPDGSELSPDIAEKIDWPNMWLIRPVSPPPSEFLQENWDDMSKSKRNEWYQDLHCTVEGWKMMATTKCTDDICVMFNKKDHTIFGKNIPPGVYKFIIADYYDVTGSFYTEITVPDLPLEELSKKIIDLGEIRLLPPSKKLSIKDRVTEFLPEGDNIKKELNESK